MDKILIIDDSKLIIKKLVQILNKDYAVFPLISGENAFEMAAFVKPSLILLDIIMPKVNGYQVIEQLKAHKETTNIPVIFLTTLNDETDEEKGFAYGAVDYITKPVKDAIVKARVKAHINLYKKNSQELNFPSKTYLDKADAALFDYDYTTNTISFSRSFATKFEIPDYFENFPETFFNTTDIIDKENLEEFKGIIDDIVNGTKPSFECIVKFKLPNDSIVWYSIYYNTIFRNSGEPWRAIGMMNDVTHKNASQASGIWNAKKDKLTGLLNGDEAKGRIEKCISSNKLCELHAFILADIDNFRNINDNLGRQFGDTLLADIGTKIRTIFRDSDITGRLCSDEFVILMRSINDESEAIFKSKELCEALKLTFLGEHKKYHISVSIGIVFFQNNSHTFEELFSNATTALYASKCQGKGRFTVYCEDMLNKNVVIDSLMDESYSFISRYYCEDLCYNVFEMLYETKDLSTTINIILEIVGKKYYLDSISIYKFRKHTQVKKDYEWCNKKVEFPSPVGTLFNMTEFVLAFDGFNSDGLYFCNDTQSFAKDYGNYFELDNKKSFLLSAMYDKDEIIGYICFSDYSKQRVWSGEEIASLGYISRILSVFLYKKHISKKLQQFINNDYILNPL